jgi:hypothetical protein
MVTMPTVQPRTRGVPPGATPVCYRCKPAMVWSIQLNLK